MQPTYPATDEPRSRDLFGEVLASVSRSFYLTLRVLPVGLRRPIGLAYLLARTSDTIADSVEGSAALRLLALRQFIEALEHHPIAPLLKSLDALEAGVSDAAERRLLSLVPEQIRLFQETEEGDRDEILRVLRVIVQGQELDVERFSATAASGAPVICLKDAAELEDYTYRVAGCVGEFWTRICFRHLPDHARLPQEEMTRLGIAFGKGLQLVNILRDLPRDLQNGRCYFPSDEIGVSPQTGLPTDFEPAYGVWLSKASEWLDAGRLYLETVRPWRLRLALFLPWALGVRTIRLLRQSPSYGTEERVKVPRREVKILMLWSVLVAVAGNWTISKFLQRHK